MSSYFVPYLDIKPKALGHNNYELSNNIKNTIGKIKDEINLDAIRDKLYTNQEFVEYVNASNYHFIPINDYYSKDVANYFDIFGGIYDITIDDIDYNIKVYFYKLKNVELITKDIINKFKVIFQYDYFIKNNILNMVWHYYRLNSHFINNLHHRKFLDLSFDSKYTKTKLFNHQKHNISRMLKIHQNPVIIPISDHMPIYFENDLIYNMVTNQFITPSDITHFNINSGMIVDEPGTGKTLQFILYILETKLRSLILVPNEIIKYVWIDEVKKNIDVEAIPFDILTFTELERLLDLNFNHLDQYQIIGIDEIHNLYKNINVNPIFDKIVESKIKYRWGISGTPFVSDTSLFQIIKFLSGYLFVNERIANSPKIQSDFMQLFLKNRKTDMIDDYQWPELIVNDVKVKLDIVQQNLYNAEKMLNINSVNLRKIVCEINLMFENGEFKTPSELKKYGIQHYNKLYDIECQKLTELENQLSNIKENKDSFDSLEYVRRLKHFEYLINGQKVEIEKHRKVAEYFMNSISEINKLLTAQKNQDTEMNIDTNDGEDNDSVCCKICWNPYEQSISYFKICGHYFCKACIDTLKQQKQDNYDTSYVTIQCPMCRKEINNTEIINVNNVCDINNSSKIHELLNIINGDEKYIIFTQYSKVISKIQSFLERNNVTSSTLDSYTNEKILLLSSEQNAEGINLTHFDKMIIFEPFEDNIYNNQVEKQLIARIHRVGRVKPVNIYRFITEGTIEEDIYYDIKSS
jgi:SNF2 family DNA or RNA helicase